MNNELDLAEKQKVSLAILRYVANFCENNDIRYYLAYGTLLGAIRHKGFIPWDDDVDVFVPRPDYERFLKEFVDTDEYRLVSCFNTNDYVYPFAKVQNVKTKMKLPSGKLINQGLGIDLFPVDGIPNDSDLKKAEEIFKIENKVFNDYIQRYDAFKFIMPKTIKEHVKVFAYKLSIVSGRLNKKGRLISVNPYESDYDSCEKVASVVGIHSGIFRPFKAEWFNPINVEFEDTTFIVPSGYDEILSMIYHDYMTLPPEEQRQTTHIAKYVWA